jgi:hypothetical protein
MRLGSARTDEVEGFPEQSRDERPVAAPIDREQSSDDRDISPAIPDAVGGGLSPWFSDARRGVRCACLDTADADLA